MTEFNRKDRKVLRNGRKVLNEINIIKMQRSQSFAIENCDCDYFYCKDKELKTATAAENYLVVFVLVLVAGFTAGFFLS